MAVGCGKEEDFVREDEAPDPVSEEAEAEVTEDTGRPETETRTEAAEKPMAKGNSDAQAAVRDFSLRLFRENLREKGDTLVSPVSSLYALAMAAGGAKGNTLEEMEKVFGVPVEELQQYLGDYMESLPEDKGCKVHAANSVWLLDSPVLKVKEDFLEQSREWGKAQVFEEPFDGETLQKVNGWVDENTDGMIEQILDEIPGNAMMYLVNATAFDAKWQEPYTDIQVQDGFFTGEGGSAREVTMLHSEEYCYLEGEGVAGFVKYYEGGAYAFAALLPEEGLGAAEYAGSLTGDALSELFEHAQSTAVAASMPKFSSEFSTDLAASLRTLGMEDAFSMQDADFTGIGTCEMGNLYISRVLHKTRIDVDEAGTKAGAATAVEMRAGGAMTEEPKQVVLDRPFVYFLMDMEREMPLFAGVFTGDSLGL